MERYRIPQIAIALDALKDKDELETLRRRASAFLGLPADAVGALLIERKSVDARDKNAVKLVYGVLVEADLDAKFRSLPSRRSTPRGHRRGPGTGGSAGVGYGEAAAATAIEPAKEYALPPKIRQFPERPIVVGAGPAGLFAALILAEAGARPLLIERGDAVEVRDARIRAFEQGGDLDGESNVQFGEGGAGTYSDGKLTTQVRDEGCRNSKVIKELIAAGAPGEIAFLAKPHIGTDRLIATVAGLRQRILSLGGEVRFRTRLDGILAAADSEPRPGGPRVVGVLVNGTERIPTDTLILAPGHSSRDTFALLERLGIDMEPKPFAIGLRIEHPQEAISRAQYGRFAGHPALPQADYKLAARTADGRGVYSFCMCPGGTVVNASSEAEGVVCNGMSDFDRDGPNANAAIVVSVNPEDFGYPGVLGGVEFQRRWERLAFAAGGGTYALPVQTLGEFREGRAVGTGRSMLGTGQPPASGTWPPGNVRPSATRAWLQADLWACLPPFAARGILEGMDRFGRILEGFDRSDAILTGVETRTSSPVRILRNQDCRSSLSGLYPAGEGAGYAGGIMSAAMDGIRVAEAALKG